MLPLVASTPYNKPFSESYTYIMVLPSPGSPTTNLPLPVAVPMLIPLVATNLPAVTLPTTSTSVPTFKPPVIAALPFTVKPPVTAAPFSLATNAPPPTLM